jgi:hypothetical protein
MLISPTFGHSTISNALIASVASASAEHVLAGLSAAIEVSGAPSPVTLAVSNSPQAIAASSEAKPLDVLGVEPLRRLGPRPRRPPPSRGDGGEVDRVLGLPPVPRMRALLVPGEGPARESWRPRQTLCSLRSRSATSARSSTFAARRVAEVGVWRPERTAPRNAGYRTGSPHLAPGRSRRPPAQTRSSEPQCPYSSIPPLLP